MRRPAACAALSIWLLGLPALAAEETERPTIYKWVDENGIAHYTTDKKRIPKNLRNRIRDAEEVKRERAEAAAAAPAAAIPADFFRKSRRLDFIWVIGGLLSNG